MLATGSPADLVSQRRVLPPGQRPRDMAVRDFAPGAAAMGAGALDGVFAFGGDEEAAFIKAAGAKASDDQRVQVLGLVKSADAHLQAGRLQTAANEVEEAQKLVQELSFEEGRALTMTMVARIYAKQGALSTADQLDEAEDYASEAQEKFQKFGSKKCEATALLALASARYALRKFDAGMQAAKEAQLLLQGSGDKFAEAQVYHMVVDGFVLKGELRKAIRFMIKGKAIYASLNDKRAEAACAQRMADIEGKAGNKDGALKAFDEARSILKDLRDLKSEVALLGAIRDYHKNDGRLAEAVDVAKEIVTLHHGAGEVKGEGLALVDLADLLTQTGHLGLAANLCVAAHKVFASIRDPEGMAKLGEVHGRWKNETLKQQIKQQIEENRDFAHYPEDPHIELGLSKLAREALGTVKVGL